MAYTYILKCSDNTLYTGWTTDIKRRVKQHNMEKGAKYTKGRCPVVLVHLEEYDDKIEAMKREYEIKQMSRKEKILLINNSGE